MCSTRSLHQTHTAALLKPSAATLLRAHLTPSHTPPANSHLDPTENIFLGVH